MQRLRSLASFNVLAIETSCDDTAVAIVSSTRKVVAQVIIGQNASHQPYHGIVPRMAAQLHRANLPIAIRDCISKAGLDGIKNIDAIAATRGPGLANCLSAGFLAGRSIAVFNNLPFYGTHHMVKATFLQLWLEQTFI
jgi:N6-L-threonylcarbamoyladenine synthase